MEARCPTDKASSIVRAKIVAGPSELRGWGITEALSLGNQLAKVHRGMTYDATALRF